MDPAGEDQKARQEVRTIVDTDVNIPLTADRDDTDNGRRTGKRSEKAVRDVEDHLTEKDITLYRRETRLCR